MHPLGAEIPVNCVDWLSSSSCGGGGTWMVGDSWEMQVSAEEHDTLDKCTLRMVDLA